MKKQVKELHLFMPIGDDEIQVESWNRELNKRIMNLKAKEPEAVYIINEDEYPEFLRAAVRTQNISFEFHKTRQLTEKQLRARSQTGKHTHNLISKSKEDKN